MFGWKAKKERKKLIERHLKIFRIQLSELRHQALKERKTLREAYLDKHQYFKERQATNIITSERLGRGEHTKAMEIEDLKKREQTAEDIFHEALDQFIQEVGEVELPDPNEKTDVQLEEKLAREKAENPETPAETEEPADSPAQETAQEQGDARAGE